ncbi:MAG TPA: hypothetical protein DEB25_04285 [Desulfobulbaceae bacterium]|nr:hypothetical protein [Desulfobulbaceae bacterium]
MENETDSARDEAELARLLTRRWLGQLRREFAMINVRYGLGLRPAVFALHQGLTRLGFWEKDNRRLSISFDLVERYGWAAALLVLKHEMAHQMADECPGQRPGAARPHDETFLAACRRLDLPLSFCRAVINEEALAATRRESDEGHPLVRRVQKLLALAQSDNIHEAALALTKARQLLARQDMSEDELLGEEVIYLPIALKRQRVSGVTRRLFGVISGIFPVSIIETSLYDPWQDREMPVFEVFGRRGAVHFAVHAWHFLAERLESLWRRQRQGQNSGRRERDSFMLGVLMGVEEILRRNQAAETKTPETRALITADADPAVTARLRRRYPHLRRRRLAGRMVSSGHYEEGIEAGRRIKICEVVGQSKTGKFLPT